MSPPLQVLLEGEVEERADGFVPFPEVGDGLASRADLELDEPQLRVVGRQALGDAAQVVDVCSGVAGVAHHAPLDGVGAADLAFRGGGGAVGVPGVGADADEGGGRHQVALVFGQVDAHPVGFLGVEGVPHGFEVGQPAAGEVVAFGGFQVDAVEPGQVGAFPPGDRHTQLVGLLDVAAPQLIHALQQLLVGQCRAFGVGQAQQFAAAIVVVLFDVQQATIHQVVALRGDGLFGDTPQGADVALCAGFFRIKRVEDGEGGGVDALLFRPAVVEAEDVGEDAAQLEDAVGFLVHGGFRWRGRDGSLQTGLRPGGEPKAVQRVRRCSPTRYPFSLKRLIPLGSHRHLSQTT